MDINYKNIIENLHDGLYLVDRDRRIIYWNKAAEKITGYKAEEVIGSKCSDNILVHIDDNGRQLCLHGCPLLDSILKSNYNEAKLYLLHKDGHRIPIYVKTAPLFDKEGNIVGGSEIFANIAGTNYTELKVEELKKLALVDELTQLANRRCILSELELAIEQMRIYGSTFGVLFFDIDHFKQVNDKYGHDIGDLALKTIAKTAVASSRIFDLFGRWGGEEFVGIIKNVTLEGLKAESNKLRVLVEHTKFKVKDSFINATISIGATLAKKGDTVDCLIKRSDDLMYKSKQNGRNRSTSD